MNAVEKIRCSYAKFSVPCRDLQVDGGAQTLAAASEVHEIRKIREEGRAASEVGIALAYCCDDGQSATCYHASRVKVVRPQMPDGNAWLTNRGETLVCLTRTYTYLFA